MTCVVSCESSNIVLLVNVILGILLQLNVFNIKIFLVDFIGVPIDGDNPQHIMWICEKAKERADEYNISGVNYRLTQGKYY